MFFLEQIKTQFLSQIALYEERVGENGGSGVADSVDKDFLTDAEKALDTDESIFTIAGKQQLPRFIQGLEDALTQDPNAVAEDSEEIAKLRANIERLKRTLQEAQADAGSIRAKLLEAAQLDITQIKTEIAEMKDTPSESLKVLESQRDSYIASMKSQIGAFTPEEQKTFSDTTKQFIELSITNFDIAYPPEANTNELKQEYLSSVMIPALIENEIELSILLRDEKNRKTGEELGEGRNQDVLKRYKELQEKFTEAQKEIVDGRSFDELKVADFQKLWLHEGVDISSLFISSENGSGIQSEIGATGIISFGGNPEVGYMLPSLLPLGVESIKVDGKIATRVSNTRFEYEGGLPIEVKDGSKIEIVSIDDLPPNEKAERVEKFEEVLKSNDGRQQMEEQVESTLRGRSLSERKDENMIDFLKRIINTLAVKFGFGEIFATYSDADLQAIAENGGMQRFIPNGAEILKDGQFMESLQTMCSKLGVQRDHMLVVMQAESGLNYKAINPTSGASGLIQFMPATAKGLGTSVEAIRNMSATEQLVYVEKYFENYAGKMKSVEDIYRVVFYPAAIGKPNDWVLGSQNGTAGKVASQNPGIAKYSQRGDGLIDNNAFARYVQAKVGQFMSMDYSGESSGTATPEGINVEALPKSRKEVVQAGLEAYKNKDILGAAHCTDWVDKIYQKQAGVSVYSAPKLYEGGVYEVDKKPRDTGYRTKEYASDEVFNKVQAGDHIMVDHGPDFGKGRTHSVIALESPNDGILRVVSYPNGGKPPRVELYDLTGQGRNGARPEKAMRIHSPV